MQEQTIVIIKYLEPLNFEKSVMKVVMVMEEEEKNNEDALAEKIKDEDVLARRLRKTPPWRSIQ